MAKQSLFWQDLPNFGPKVARIAQGASKIILNYYRKQTPSQIKTDGSPVTEADLASHQFIVDALAVLTPDIAVFSEENPTGVPRPQSTYWLLDPLDGTKEFLRGNDEFAINLSLFVDNQTVFALIHAVTEGESFIAAKGQGAFVFRESSGPVCEKMPRYADDEKTVLISRSHQKSEATLVAKAWPDCKIKILGSSLKFCRVADGKAFIYLRQTPCMEWDSAAGELLIQEIGGQVINLNGEPLTYHKENPLQREGFIAARLDEPQTRARLKTLLAAKEEKN